MEHAAKDAHADTPDNDLAAQVGRIANTIGASHFPSGDRAAFKRFALGQSPGLAYYRFWPRWMGAEAPPDRQADDWSLLLFGLAIMGPGGHRRGRSLGTALAEAGYSEARLERLLATDDPDTRRQLFARMARYLAAKGAGFDWVEAAAWLLVGPDSRDQRIRRIARDYYRAQYRAQKDSAKE